MDDKRRRILVVDDDVMQLNMMKNYLREHYNVTAVNSGKSALKFLEGHECDLIFLDFIMPEESGAQVYYKLKDNPKTKDIPVVFLTGLNEKKVVIKTLTELKPEGYIIKPASKQDLDEKIISVLG